MTKNRNEFDLIARYFAPLAGVEGLGLTDDAAFLSPPAQKQLVVTTDAIAEDVHYRKGTPPDLIARKLLRVNLSDLAAKGAAPWCYVVSLVLPPDADVPWIAAFAKGLKQDQKRYGITLAGGDTTVSKQGASFSLTAVGLVDTGHGIRRNSAKAGDGIYVTGTLGDAAIGLRLGQEKEANTALPDAHRKVLLARYHLPQPRVAFGRSLHRFVHACMDISDGLAQDMAHICNASNLGAVIEQARLPLSRAAKRWIAINPDYAQLPLNGGDDYELLLTMPETHETTARNAATEAGTTLTRIGTMTPGRSVKIVDRHGKAIDLVRQGWQHL